jgi:hypothetical protein
VLAASAEVPTTGLLVLGKPKAASLGFATLRHPTSRALVRGALDAKGNLTGMHIRISGQSILAAGLQVGVAPHAESDPSLRGLDVWVGDTGNYAGSVTNTGLVESQRGSILAVGRRITQAGVMESSTSVNLNGRIDLLASYGAIGFPGYDPTSQPPFLNRSTGIVEFSPGALRESFLTSLPTRKSLAQGSPNPPK